VRKVAEGSTEATLLDAGSAGVILVRYPTAARDRLPIARKKRVIVWIFRDCR
jgi:hypothetical protein